MGGWEEGREGRREGGRECALYSLYTQKSSTVKEVSSAATELLLGRRRSGLKLVMTGDTSTIPLLWRGGVACNWHRQRHNSQRGLNRSDALQGAMEPQSLRGTEHHERLKASRLQELGERAGVPADYRRLWMLSTGR